MATKPSFIPAWCTTGTRAAPTPPEQASGWSSGDRPSAQQLNWLVGLLGDWSAYLSDGALAGNHTITGTLGVSGLTTLNGGGNVPTGRTLTAASGGTLAVASGGTLDLAGNYKHGDREVNIAASAFTLSTAAGAIGSGTVAELNGHEWLFIAGATHLTAPLMLPVGSRVKSIDFICDRGGHAAQLFFRKRTGSTTSTIATGTAAGTGLQANTMSAINYTVEASYRVWLHYQPGGTNGTFEGCRVIYDRP